MSAPEKDKWYFFNPISINTHTRVFGYRSAVFRLVLSLGACMAMGIWFSGFTLLVSICGSVLLNIDAIDLKKITVDDNYIYITRYLKLTVYDFRFWTKDINAAIIWQGRGCYKLHMMLKDGSEQKIDLLGMVWFERAMLQRYLNKLNLPEQGQYKQYY